MLIALLLFSALIRLVGLGEPRALVFDETYYAKDACIYLHYKPSTCGLSRPAEQSYVHPPLGKWIIAAGMKVFGYTPFGRRVSAALFGVGLVWLVFVLAGRLFRDRWIAWVSGLLVATDFLLVVQSRMAMLDIFLAFFVTLGFLFVVMDREAVLAVRHRLEMPTAEPVPARGLQPRLLAGFAFGLALAVKWSAVYALVAAALFSVYWSFELERLQRLRPAGNMGRRTSIRRDLGIAAVAFALVPLVVYVSSYVDYFREQARQDCAYVVPASSEKRFFREGFDGLKAGECLTGMRGVVLSFADLQERVARYHLTLTAKHPYQSRAWSWPLVLRPVAYYYNGQDGKSREIIAMGNVFTWWGALVAAGWLALRSARKFRAERVVAAAWGLQYLPWLLVSRPLFFFYMTPVVPFMMIGLAAALGALRRRGSRSRRLVTIFLVLGVGVMFILYLPVLTAITLPYRAWRYLMWFGRFGCGGLTCGWI